MTGLVPVTHDFIRQQQVNVFESSSRRCWKRQYFLQPDARDAGDKGDGFATRLSGNAAVFHFGPATVDQQAQLHDVGDRPHNRAFPRITPCPASYALKANTHI
jgi:hypothetical protein